MSIQFPPNSSVPVAAQVGPVPAAAPLAALMMAAVELTPLAPPASGPRPAAPPSREAGSAAGIRQDRFAERRNALLDRLQQRDATASSGAGTSLSAEQRRACLSVLAIAAAAGTGE